MRRLICGLFIALLSLQPMIALGAQQQKLAFTEQAKAIIAYNHAQYLLFADEKHGQSVAEEKTGKTFLDQFKATVKPGGQAEQFTLDQLKAYVSRDSHLLLDQSKNPDPEFISIT